MAEENSNYQTFIHKPVTLIGAGGIGSLQGPMIARCGARIVTIYDYDTFKPVNLQVQNVNHCDLGKNKAHVVASYMHALNPLMQINVFERAFTQGDHLDDIVIAAVHSVEARRMIFEEVLLQKDTVSIFLDGRLSRKYHEFFELFVIDPNVEAEVEEYRKWLYPGQTFPEKEPRPTKLAAHTTSGLVWATGCVFARLSSGERRPWRIVGDGVGGIVESFF